KRARGLRERQQQLLQNRTRKKDARNWNALAFVGTVFLMLVVNGAAAFVLRLAVESGQSISAEQNGKIVVSRRFLNEVKTAENATPASLTKAENYLDDLPYSEETERIADREGGSAAAVEEKLR